MSSVASALTALRGAVKSAVYSGPARDRWQHPDRVIAALGVRPGQRVADLGAGGGYFTYRLADVVGPQGVVYAVDTDPDLRARIQARSARQGYANITPLDPGTDGLGLPERVDLLLTVDAFHHLPDETRYFAALAGELAPGGQLAIIEPTPRWFLFGHATEPARIRSVMTDAGYVAAEAHDFLPRQSFTIWEPS